MDDPLPNFNLPPEPEKKSFPWVVIVLVVVIAGVSAWWMFSNKSTHPGHEMAVVALDQQLDQDRAVLDAEREKSVEMTRQLEIMKEQYQLGKVADKQQALLDYSKLDAAHNAQRDKVKTLTDQYNAKLASLQKVQ